MRTSSVFAHYSGFQSEKIALHYISFQLVCRFNVFIFFGKFQQPFSIMQHFHNNKENLLFVCFCFFLSTSVTEALCKQREYYIFSPVIDAFVFVSAELRPPLLQIKNLPLEQKILQRRRKSNLNST